VFDELWRVLKPDGTLWLNLGDSYAADGGPGWQGKNGERADRRFTGVRDTVGLRAVNRRPPGVLKPKDLVGIPWRVAFALQAEGWWLRSDIVWAKANCMPESIKDRPTRAHEYIFLLTKSERYFYDAAAIKEPASEDTHARYARGRSGRSQYPGNQTITKTFEHMRKQDGVGKDRYTGFNDRYFGQKAADSKERLVKGNARFYESCNDRVEFRNKRSVWHIATKPYPEAHYATFPEEIPDICIRAGSRPGDLILDPFFGSGTVGRVAERLSRRWVGLDLGYQDLQLKRIGNVQKELSLK
jgi:site-specific DNA-methyltransferase (cytosine-N4-specific)